MNKRPEQAPENFVLENITIDLASVVDQDSDLDWIRIQEGRNDPQKWKS
jgi:hypothetical protein